MTKESIKKHGAKRGYRWKPAGYWKTRPQKLNIYGDGFAVLKAVAQNPGIKTRDIDVEYAAQIVHSAFEHDLLLKTGPSYAQGGLYLTKWGKKVLQRSIDARHGIKETDTFRL
jgi:hypothetical protein